MADFKERLELITKRNKKIKPPGRGRPWPMAKKIEAVSHYLVLGNMAQVAAIVGVNYDLLREWKTQTWWTEIEKELRATQNIELDTKLTKIVDKSLDAVLDRVENGDFIYDQKSGEVRRKPAALRDIHRVAVDSISKRELIRGDEKVEHAKLSIEEHLKMLAMEMAKWNQKPQKPVIDLVEVEDAVYSPLAEQSGESGEIENLPPEMEGEEPRADSGEAEKEARRKPR